MTTLRRLCWLGVVLWAAGVFTISELSGPQIEVLNTFELWDKFLHFLAFFCGALPLVPALRLTWPWPWKKIALIALAALSAYGALDEVHQTFTASRSGLDPGDWLADTIGALAGVLLAARVVAWWEKRRVLS